ncbi:MAG: glycosyltransferase family 10 [Bacteroidota bacterium]
MEKRKIKIKFQNGLSFKGFKEEVFDVNGVSALFDFEETTDADFIVFGPYGNDIPPTGNYIRVGYFCEKIDPDLTICEWAFGIPHEEKIINPRYKRIQWHGTDPKSLIKPDNYNTTETANTKTRFCNFLYTHRVNYRERFFKQLSAYKTIDAPGRSMNNMQSIDELFKGNMWERKRQFLLNYKFTIAFENYIYPGYQTEKLYDAMLTNSIPIYFGDPLISSIFNKASFINAADYMEVKNKQLIMWLEKKGQLDFVDIRPMFFKAQQHRIKRKFKTLCRDLKMRLLFNSVDFSKLIDRIIELDQDKEKYMAMLAQPWFIDNTPPANSLSRDRWVEIFTSAK